MSCYLRVCGDAFDVVEYLKASDFEDVHHYFKGQSKTPKSNPKMNIHRTSGVTITASDAEQSDFAAQISESIQFLKAKKKEIERLLRFPGIESARLDYGIERKDVFGQFDYFPPELLRLAGQLGIGIELSQYPATMKVKTKLKSTRKKTEKKK